MRDSPRSTRSVPFHSRNDVHNACIIGYGMAVVTIGAALVLRVWLEPMLGDRIPFATFFAGVAVTAWFGGLGPCLLAIALGVIASWYFVLEPRYTLALHLPYQLLGLVTFVITGLVIGAFSQRMRSAVRQADLRANEAAESQ